MASDTSFERYHRATHKGARNDTAAVTEARSNLVRSGSDLNRRLALELDASTRPLRQRTLTSDRKHANTSCLDRCLARSFYWAQILLLAWLVAADMYLLLT